MTITQQPTHLCVRRTDRMIGILLILLILAIPLTSCRGKKAAHDRPTAPEGDTRDATLPAVPAAWRCDGTEARIQAVRLEDRHLLIDLILPADAPAPSSPARFNLCLPDRSGYTCKVRRYALGGQIVQNLSADDQPTTGTRPNTQKPGEGLSVQRRGYLRNWVIGQLSVNPEFWKGGPGRLRRQEEVAATLEVTWNGPAEPGQTPAKAQAAESPMMEVARRLVANPEGLERWGTDKPPLKKGVLAQPADPRTAKKGLWARVTIDKAGIYRLTADDLKQAGLPSDAAALKKARLFSGGQPEPLHRVQMGQPQPQTDGLYFYGWPAPDAYGNNRIYWLTVDEESKADGPAWPPTPEDLSKDAAEPIKQIHRVWRLDRDNKLKIDHGNFLSIEGLHWLDEKVTDQKPVQVPIRLDHPLPPGEQPMLRGKITFHLDGPPEDWKKAKLALKHAGQIISDFSFTQPDDTVKSFQIPSAMLADALTTLMLEVTQSAPATQNEESEEGIWLNKVELEYRARPSLDQGRLILDQDALTTHGIYQLSMAGPIGTSDQVIALRVNPSSRLVTRIPIQADSATCPFRDGWHTEIHELASAPRPRIEEALRDETAFQTGEKIDYLILTHESLKPALDPLLELNQRRGLKTRVVDVQQVYDAFNGGKLSPEAIRAYLAWWMREAGSAAPQYVLLVGDATSDYLDELRAGVKNLVPTYSYQHGKDKWASDLWLALFAGEDNLPDAIIGRLSVDNLDNARAVIAKIVAYAGPPVYGPWRARLGAVADNLENYESSLAVGQFEAAAETARTQCTPQAFSSRRIYLSHMALEDNWYVPDNFAERVWAEEKTWMKVSGQATRAIKNAFDDGVAQLDFYGHGSPNIWTDERIWFGGDSPNRDTLALAASCRPCFVVNFTCNSGAIDYPARPWNICISEDLMRTPNGGAVGLFVPSGPGSTPTHEQLTRLWRKALFEDNMRAVGPLATLTRARYALKDLPTDHLMMYILLSDPALDLQLTRRWQTLTLEPATAAAGEWLTIAGLDGVRPEQGRALAWLETETGETLWKSDAFDYKGGRLSASIEVPAAVLPPARLFVYVYGWNEKQGGDFIASAVLEVRRPAVEIRSATASRLDEQRVGFYVTLENKGQVEPGDLDLKVLTAGARDDQALAMLRRENLEAKEIRAFELIGPVARQNRPICLEALVGMAMPPDDPAQPQTIRKRFLLPPDQPWTGLVPEMCEVVAAGPRGRTRVNVFAYSSTKPESAIYLYRRGATGDAPTSQPLKFQPEGAGFIAQASLAPLRSDRLTTASADDRIELVNPNKNSSTEPRVLDQMSLIDLPRIEPRLRVKPESIKHQPEKPTDGQTIYISFDVENIGTAPSSPCRPMLLDGAPDENGKPLSRQNPQPTAQLPALGPGRSYPVTLRWDPIHNAGIQKIWIDASAGTERDQQAIREQAAPYRFYVKTKSKLSRPRPMWVTQSPQDAAANRYSFHVEVANEGETDAHDVEVTYYRSELKRPEDKLGVVPIAIVPAKGKFEAVLKCEVRRDQDRPVAEVRLKGSAQRLK